MKTQPTSLPSHSSVALAAIVALGLVFTSGARAQTLAPPPVTVLQNHGQLADGLIFISPQGPANPANPVGVGPEIIDNQGRPVWFSPVTAPGGVGALDFRVQTYQGKPVLTWSQGAAPSPQQTVPTVDYILDDTYNVIATVQAGNGLNADRHEFQLTPQNTALIVINHFVLTDLSSVGGAADGRVYEGAIQEVEVATGKVLLEWHSLADVPVTDSYTAVPSAANPNAVYDYFHINSVSVDTDGNLLVSSRHTWTIYKINRTTGALMWRLGGKRSDFALGAGLPFAWQHNAIAVNADTIRIFDNESNGTPVLPYSRVIWVQRDESTMTASVIWSIQHPDGVSAGAMGNAEALDNGNTLVGWGQAGRFSEFDAAGQLVFDATEPNGFSSYRAYRYPWVGRPSTNPAATAQANGDGTMSIHAVWNGATEVATWRVLGGSVPESLYPIATAAWNGLDTAIRVLGQVPYVQVVALDATGATIGTSSAAVVPVVPGVPMAAQPTAQTVASGSTAVFTAAASGASGLSYQWYRNGTMVNGATGSSLVINNATSADAGTYALEASNAAGSAIISATTLTIANTTNVSRMGNFSVLTNAGTASEPLIAGFSLGGAGTSGSATVLVRTSGPALAQFGVNGVLADPALTVFDGATAIAANNDWNSPADTGAAVTSVATAVGAFPFSDPGSLDSALVCTLPANDYTALVSGNGNGSGIVLIEVYDATAADTPNAPHLNNMSVRGRVGTGADILAAGFVVQGNTSKTVLIRATGPALGAFGVAGALPDPQLTLHSTVEGRDTVVAVNAGWSGDQQLSGAGNRVGAFALSDPASADSAVLVTLLPGAYTVDVSSVSGATGVALLEIYEVP